jgi:hypothetical protein
MKNPLSRRTLARKVRDEAAEIAFLRPHSDHLNNGEESEYRNPDNQLNYIANFSKGLPHNELGEVDPKAYRSLLKALTSSNPDDFEKILLGNPTSRKLTNPQAGLAFDLEGSDSHSLAIRPAPRIDSPENSSEMAELYWMALLRDIHFTEYDSNSMVADAANDLSNNFTDFRGPKQGNPAVVTPGTLFRGITLGDLAGPYVSQFLLIGNTDKDLNLTPKHGLIAYGVLKLNQRQKTALAGIDYLTDFHEWLAIQNGNPPLLHDQFDQTRRFIRNLRDLATYVHFDALYEAYLNACLILLAMGAPFDPGNPYTDSSTQIGFGTFGGPHILSLVTEVATRALKAVWFQKWFVHRRLRPEAFGGLIDNHKNNRRVYPINEEILNSPVLPLIFEHNKTRNTNLNLSKDGSYLLPIAFPEGSPTHPAYGAGHATVAGACVTILKAWFDESFVIPKPMVAKADPDPAKDGTMLEDYHGSDKDKLTVGGELNKLAANIAIARNGAGVHWRSDYTESVKLGEAIAISILQEQKLTYNEDFTFTLTKFDGTAITI